MPVREVSSIAATFGIVGAVSSQIFNLSAIPSMVQIIRAKSTLLYPAFPFIVGLTASLNGLVYCVITKQWIVVISTSFSVSFNFTYLCIHLVYSRKRREIARFTAILMSCLVSTAGIGPLIACVSKSVDSCLAFTVDWIGVVNTVVYCLVYCGQLWTLRQIVKTRNSASISPWLTAGVTFTATMWTIYSVLVPDYYYLVSSIVGDLSSVAQIALLIRYPRLPMQADDRAIPQPPVRIELQVPKPPETVVTELIPS